MRLTIIYTTLFIASIISLHAQQIGHVSHTFIDASRNNRQIDTEVYYPAKSAGSKAEIMDGRFPVIVFGHGFLMPWTAYENIWTDLVPEGYIVAFPKTEGGFAPVHQDFATDLSFLAESILSSGVGTTIAPTAVDEYAALMGHSMGGGAAFLAAQRNTRIATLITLAAANTNPSAIAAASFVQVPTLQFGGQNDCVTPPAQHQIPMYDANAASYNTLINIKGGGHCFFAENNISCNIGENSCTPSPTISRSQQQAVVSEFIKPWLAFYLKKNTSSAAIFQDSIASSNRILYQQNQSIIPIPVSLIHVNAPSAQIAIYPNPASQFITLHAKDYLISSLKIIDQLNKVVLHTNVDADRVKLDISELIPGIYTVLINNTVTKKIVVKQNFTE
jgi:pimeloyl-ACP methyl ester carboxylesterase